MLIERDGLVELSVLLRFGLAYEGNNERQQKRVEGMVIPRVGVIGLLGKGVYGVLMSDTNGWSMNHI